jgi:hypothetical protein
MVNPVIRSGETDLGCKFIAAHFVSQVFGGAILKLWVDAFRGKPRFQGEKPESPSLLNLNSDDG